MSIASIKNKILTIDWYTFLYAGILATLLLDYFSLIDPGFSGIPSVLSGGIRFVMGVVAVLRFISCGDKLQKPFKVILPMLAAAGLAVYFGTGMLFVLDIALLKMCSIDVKGIRIAFGLFATSFVSICITALLARKGYIRDYTFKNFDAIGFTKSYYAAIVIALAVISLLLTIVFFLIKRKSYKKTELIYLLLIGIISTGLVMAVVLRLDRTRAISDGSYTIYYSDSVQGIEMHMHGIEDYDLSLDTHEALPLEIKYEGQYYGIYADTNGVQRTLCVVDGQLKLGDYDMASGAHCWSVTSLPGTPYFWIQNAETGLCICKAEDGSLGLRMQEVPGRIHESCLFRIGDENLSYYESINTEENSDKKNISDAAVNFEVNTNYTGEAIRGNIVITYNNDTLAEGRDYTVEYADNFYPGEATVYIRGTGDYCGEIILNFNIIIDNSMIHYSNSDKVQDYIFRAYRLGYNRFPTVEEFRSLNEEICINVLTPDTLLWRLLDNGAFEGTNAEFVEGIYRLMLQRNGTRSEYDLWVNALNSGVSRYAIVDEISSGPDYQRIWPDFNLNFH